MCRGSKVQDSLRAVLVADIVEETLEFVVLRCVVEDVGQHVAAGVGDGLAVRRGVGEIDGILRQIDAGIAGTLST